MLRKMPLFTVTCLLSVEALVQTPAAPKLLQYVYYPPTQDKLSWQRLNLRLSANYRLSGMAGREPDRSLLLSARSLGLSLLPVAAEGIDDPELFAQSKWFDEEHPTEGVRLLSQATGKKRLQLMLLLGAYYNFHPISFRVYNDSTDYFLKKAIAESKALHEGESGRIALCQLAKLYAMRGDTTARNTVFDQLIEECDKAGDKRTKARAYLYRGLYWIFPKGTVPTQESVNDLVNMRIAYLGKAGKLYHELGETEGEIIALESEASMHAAFSQLEDAYTLYLKGLELEHSIGYPYTHYTTELLAMVTTSQGKYGEPLKYSFETIRAAEATRDTMGLANFYARRALLYSYDEDRQDESLKWTFKALDRYVITKDPAVYQTLYNAVSLLGAIKGREKEALDLAIDVSNKVPITDSSDRIFHDITFAYSYMFVKDYKRAEQYGLAAVSKLNQESYYATHKEYQTTMVYTTLGSVYFTAGQYAKAKKYLELDLANSERPLFLSNDIETYQQLIHIDSVYKDHASAVKHYKKYIELVDSNFRASKIRQAEELNVMYETQDKEKQILLLNQQAELEKENVRQATIVRNLMIAGAIALFMIAGLLYRQSRLRRRINKVAANKNEQLQHLLNDKEWLLKEIHHRVKNNLQIVMSLLNSQSAYIDNEPALTAIHDSQHRVHAMSLIHQKLYNSENVSSIDMSLYISELVSYLADSFNTGQRIRFEYNIEPLTMDVSQAVPLGLILNEAITNSIKYAFPDGREGLISISLSVTAPHQYLLSISDNGIGIPSHLNIRKPGSLGMSLMAGLSEDINGKFDIENNEGTTISITFEHDADVKRLNTLATSFISNN